MGLSFIFPPAQISAKSICLPFSQTPRTVRDLTEKVVIFWINCKSLKNIVCLQTDLLFHSFTCGRHILTVFKCTAVYICYLLSKWEAWFSIFVHHIPISTRYLWGISSCRLKCEHNTLIRKWDITFRRSVTDCSSTLLTFKIHEYSYTYTHTWEFLFIYIWNN